MVNKFYLLTALVVVQLFIFLVWYSSSSAKKNENDESINKPRVSNQELPDWWHKDTIKRTENDDPRDARPIPRKNNDNNNNNHNNNNNPHIFNDKDINPNCDALSNEIPPIMKSCASPPSRESLHIEHPAQPIPSHLNASYCATYVPPSILNIFNDNNTHPYYDFYDSAAKSTHTQTQHPPRRFTFGRGERPKAAGIKDAPVFWEMRRHPFLHQANTFLDTLLKNHRPHYQSKIPPYLEYYDNKTQRMYAPPTYYKMWPDHLPYVVAVPNGFINYKGEVMDCNGFRYSFIPYSCHSTEGPFMTTSKRDKVFVLSIGNGEEVYHTLVESLPRLAFFLEFVIENDITVQATRFHGLLRFLGVKKVESPYPVVAKTAYIPTPGGCGNTNTFNLLRWNQLLRARLEEKFPGIENEERYIMVVKRDSNRRPLQNHDELWDRLKKEFPDEKIELYSTERQQLDDVGQIKAFYKAKVIIAPHGAALAHILACRPDTILIEVLTKTPVINLVFLDLAAQLGLTYYPLATTTETEYNDWPLKVVVDDVVNIMREQGY